MLCVARHAGIRDARVLGGSDAEVDGRAEAADAALVEQFLDRAQEFRDLGLRRIGPGRDQIDLPAVEPLRDDLRTDAAATERLDRGSGGPVERRVLLALASRR